MVVAEEVSVKLSLLGTEASKKEMRSVIEQARLLQMRLEQSERDGARNRARIAEHSASQLAKIEERKYQAIQKLQNSGLTSFQAIEEERKRIIKNAADEAIRVEQRKGDRIRQLEEREAMRKQSFAVNTARLQEARGHGGMSLSAMGHMAQMGGFYRTGHALRALNHLGVGSELSTGGIAAAVGGVVAGFAAVEIASKLVSVGFEQVGKTAASFVNAVNKIGGARGLEEMMVEGANSQKLATDISNNITEDISPAKILEVMQNRSKESALTPVEVGQMASAYKAKTGSFSEFADMGLFPMQLQRVAVLGVEETGTILGALRQVGVRRQDVPTAAANLWMGGKLGTVELKDASSITEALGLGSALSTNTLAGLNMEMGLVQATQRYTGGQDARESTTAVRRLQDELLHNSSKFAGLGLGNYLTHNSTTGQLMFANAPHTIAQLAYGAFSGNMQFKGDERAKKALTGIAIAANQNGEFANKSASERVQIIEDMINKMKESTNSLQEFDKAVQKDQEALDYKLHNAFNKLAIALEPHLIKALEILTPYIVKLAEDMANNAPGIGTFLEDFAKGMGELSTIFPQLIAKVASIGDIVLGLLEPGEMKSKKRLISDREQILANIQNLENQPQTEAVKKNLAYQHNLFNSVGTQLDALYRVHPELKDIAIGDGAKVTKQPASINFVPSVAPDTGAQPSPSSKEAVQHMQKAATHLANIDRKLGTGPVTVTPRSKDGH